MLTFNYYFIIFILSAISLQKVQSDFEISAEDIEYAVSRIAKRQRALESTSQIYFKYEPKRKSWKKQLHLQDDIDDANENEKDIIQNLAKNNYQNRNTDKKIEATLCNIQDIQPQAAEENIPQKQDVDVEEQRIIENGVNQPHNHENQQNLTVNQAKEKQQLSQHHFKLLNVVKPRNKRQTPAVNSNDKYNNYYSSNNNGNQQQFTTYTIQYYPTNQLQQQQELQQQQQQFQLPPQQQEQQQQQYQLQYYQQPSQTTPTHSNQQFQQNFNNIEVIANGNTLSTIPQKTTATLTQTKPTANIQQQQSQSIPILITLPTTPKPPIDISTIKAPTSHLPSLPPATMSSPSLDNSFKPFLPLEIM